MMPENRQLQDEQWSRTDKEREHSECRELGGSAWNKVEPSNVKKCFVKAGFGNKCELDYP